MIWAVEGSLAARAPHDVRSSPEWTRIPAASTARVEGIVGKVMVVLVWVVR